MSNDDPAAQALSLSVIVPVYNHPQMLAVCLTALTAASFPATEIIVVDDASTEDLAACIPPCSVRVLRLTQNAGPAAARNYGAQQAQGELLFFVDADVVLPPGAIRQVVQFFMAHPHVAAVFGSYDTHPPAAGLVSQYRNLLHHFVHQQSNPAATTFWAGCGAIRRRVFEAVGGFDARRFPTPAIEDIELGYRLRQAGYQVYLDKTLQGTHLKRWTFRTMLWTDVCCRAVPWARLLLENPGIARDLNLSRAQQCSAALIGLASLCLILSMYCTSLLLLTALSLGGVGLINRALYDFFRQQRGWRFAAACMLLHWLYYLYSGMSFLYVWWRFHRAPVG